MTKVIQTVSVTIPFVIGLAVAAYGGKWSKDLWSWWVWGGLTLGLCFLAIVVGVFRRAYHLENEREPKLFVTYDDDSPDCNKLIKFKDGHKGKSIRVRVQNETARNFDHCSGWLTRIEHRPNDISDFVQVPFYEPTPLHWSLEPHGVFDPVTIYARIPRYLGIGRTYDNQDGFFPWARHLSNITPPFNQNGSYRFFIEIVGEQIPTTSVIIIINQNGQWNEVNACLVEST